MKQVWEYKDFKDCLQKIKYPKSIQKKDYLRIGNFPVISQEVELISGYWNERENLYKADKPVIVFGDHNLVLKYIDFDFVLGADGVKILKPIKIINSSFFFFFLQSIKIKSLGYARHYKQLNEFRVPIPPLSEQERIVAILEKAFSIIDEAKENAQKNLQNAKELFESYLNSVFANPGKDWVEKSFANICTLQRGYDLPTNSRINGTFPLVSSNGITDWINVSKVKSPGVVTGRSGTIGNVHFINQDFWPLNTSLFVKDFNGNSEKFIFYFLKQFKLNKYASGAGVPTLNRNNVHNVKVTLPASVTEQESIVDKLDRLLLESEKMVLKYEKKLSNLNELKKSILQKAFNGELKTTGDIEI